jgi:hypothetical protein
MTDRQAIDNWPELLHSSERDMKNCNNRKRRLVASSRSKRKIKLNFYKALNFILFLIITIRDVQWWHFMGVENVLTTN